MKRAEGDRGVPGKGKVKAMFGKTIISLTTAAALGLSSFAVAAPAQAGDRWSNGDRYNQSYRDRDYRRGDYRSYDRGYDRAPVYRGQRYDQRDRYQRCNNDGTAGTIIGAIAGGLLGHEVVGRRGDKTTGTILGGAVGAVAGRAIDKGDNRCR
jgi:hypothetical protein